MGKISKVFYQSIDPEVCSVKQSGEFFYHQNMMGLGDSFSDEYMDYEKSQIALRNSILSRAIKNQECDRNINMNSCIFGISSIKENVMICVEC